MAIEILLLEDVHDLGRAGEVHRVAPGYARNFLMPQGLAAVADKNTLRKQKRLQEERAKRAESDRAEAEKLASALEGLALTCIVKVDPQGHMYGSVSATDVQKLFEHQGHHVEKRWIHLPHAIKETGIYDLSLRLKEGISCTCKIKVLSEEEQANAHAQ